MTAPITWSINGTPIEQFGMYLSNFSGHADLAVRTYGFAQPAQRDGQVVLSQGSTTAPRVLVFNFFIQPSSFADRRAKVNALHQALRGRLELVSAEDPTKMLYGYVMQDKVTAAGKWFVQPEVNAAVTITCYDPLWYDVNPVSVSINNVNTLVALPCGSAITKRVRILTSGGTSSPLTLTLCNGAGVALSTITIAVAPAFNQFLDVQCDPDSPSVLLWSGGASTDEIGQIGNTETLFVLDPSDQPMLKIDKGTALVMIQRAWES